ncbi:methyl-accepting chemotaxis protein [Halopseudomonas aestusnigri]|jgi:methyl-accepting chemotaxis protein|uniref:methyl-accepting chemotaxis protein n=1 Tax=Halopseudomonas TaxID=2901189 RepID=UPI001E2C1416|nr:MULTISPECIES: methyl-accepting chemotaxis protein [Halopseudomonas]MDL2200727.1 methyl-accepting chemotaxis protein [Halopseudomonas aestusnigri]MEE2800015.1 methyl-accepting chemotaxis protein [Pseudomonadota bacterium]UGV31787.1 methyl-accepting chemotaxis protein [Halopseudomonas aestusnigri]BDX20563.1 chemotaxis transducer [Halopseudomonas aestusnigri]
MLSVFRDLSFRWKLTLPILILAALFVVLGLSAFWAVSKVESRLVRVSTDLLPRSSVVLEADRDMYQALAAERAIIEGVVSSGLDAEHTDNMQQASDRIARYAAATKTPEGRALADEFARAFAVWKATSIENVRLARSGDAARASDSSYGQGYEQFSRARELINKMTELINQQAEAEAAEAEADVAASHARVTVVLAIGAVVCFLMIVFFPGLITNPLRELLQRIRDIADGEGDLTRRVVVHSNDELGQLSKAFNAFLEQLQGLIRDVAESTLQVASAAEQMSAIAEGQEKLVNEQYMAVDQVSTAATEMSAAIHEVADNAHSTADAAREADRQGHSASDVVSATMNDLRRLAADVEEAAGVINNLEQDTDKIGGVLSVIEGIAEQTNLLALNAAIEAARAGEQGRGFAVVADEVRALAARTQDSTRDIQQMIQKLQSGTGQAVAVMQRGAQLAAQSVEKAGTTESSLNETSASVMRINDMAAQIAAACEEQSQTTEDIARNISGIRDLSNQSAQSSQESRDASNVLARLAANLQQQVGRFKT